MAALAALAGGEVGAARVNVAERRALLEIRRGGATVAMTANLSPRPQAGDAGDLARFEARFGTALQPSAPSPNV